MRKNERKKEKKERKKEKKEKKIKERMNEWKNIRLIYLDTHIFIYMCIHIYRVSKPTNFLTITLITPRMLYLFYRLYIFTSYVSLHPSSPLQLLYTSKSTSYIYIYIYIYISTSQIFNHHTNHNSYYKLTR